MMHDALRAREGSWLRMRLSCERLFMLEVTSGGKLALRDREA